MGPAAGDAWTTPRASGGDLHHDERQRATSARRRRRPRRRRARCRSARVRPHDRDAARDVAPRSARQARVRRARDRRAGRRTGRGRSRGWPTRTTGRRSMPSSPEDAPAPAAGRAGAGSSEIDVRCHPSISRSARRSTLPLAVSGSARHAPHQARQRVVGQPLGERRADELRERRGPRPEAAARRRRRRRRRRPDDRAARRGRPRARRRPPRRAPRAGCASISSSSRR